MTSVVILIEPNIRTLVGFENGKALYAEQVKPVVPDITQEQVELVLPMTVKKMSTSFIQGFFDEPIKKLGLLHVWEHFTLKGGKADLRKQIQDNIL